jgi:preprotein translocase subunit SecY
VLTRITAPGSLYLALVAIIPIIALILFGASQQFPFGGTAILIIVGVGLDTAKQIESQLQQRSYEGFLRPGWTTRCRKRNSSSSPRRPLQDSAYFNGRYFPR